MSSGSADPTSDPAGARPSLPRIVVVQAEGFPAPDPPALPVGVLRWAGAPERLVILVKATFTYAAGGVAGGVLAWASDAEQVPLTLGERSALPGAAPEEVRAPCDFVPRKVGCDVLVTGHAYSRAPALQIEGALRISGGSARAFTARAGAKAASIPLSAAYLFPGEPLAGRQPAAHVEDAPLDERADLSVFNAAPPGQRLADLAPSASLELFGLTPDGGPRTLVLPGLAPLVSITDAWVGEIDVEMRCDTLWIDTDAGRVALVWRGAAELYEGAAEVERIAVSMEQAGAPRARDDRRAALQRGRFGFAVRVADVARPADAAGARAASGDAGPGTAARTDEEATRLRMARYATWASGAPPPRLALAAYARLAAELAEEPAQRAETLGRHRLDEDAFAIEERAWLEKMAAAAMEGDTALVEAYGHDLARAQEALARPGEERTWQEYAEIRARFEDADDPAEALRDAGMSLARWVRVDGKWSAAAERDPALSAQIDARMRAVREARAAAAQAAHGAGGERGSAGGEGA